MKSLPDGYFREPVVAWVISHENTERNTITVMFENGIIPCIEGEGDVISIEGTFDYTPLEVIIIPALPNCFKIFRERPDGFLKPFCYEINGVFTDSQLNELMRE